MLRLSSRLAVMIAVAAATLLPGPGRAAPASLTIALPGDFPSLNPSNDTSPLGFNYRLNVFDQLTQIERDGRVSPRLSSAWTSSADLLEWTFTIRKDATFHDGGPVTTRDVVWSMRYILDDPRSPNRTFLKLVDKVELVDDDKVRFRLIEPYGIFDRQISFINIMSEAYHKSAGEAGYASRPVGSGPYRLVSWAKDDRMVLEAFPNYWGGAPALKSATFRPMPAEAARAAALISGEVNLVTTLPPALIDQLSATRGLEVARAPGSRVMFLAFNLTKSPLDNPRIREAVDLAIDREAIATRLLRGLGRATGIMVPPNNIGYDASFKAVAQDLEKAKRLIAEAGYKGETIAFQYPNNNFVMANDVAQAIAGFLTAAGLKVELKPMEFTAFFPLWLQSKLEGVYMFAFGSTQYHGDTIMTSLYEKGSRNYGSNPDIDQMIKQQRMLTNVEEQKRVLAKIFQTSNQDRYNLPLYEEHQAYGATAGLGYTPWPDGFVRLYEFK
jgi:peptide/nickel transport system substrate-binding protein